MINLLSKIAIASEYDSRNIMYNSIYTIFFYYLSFIRHKNLTTGTYTHLCNDTF